MIGTTLNKPKFKIGDTVKVSWTGKVFDILEIKYDEECGEYMYLESSKTNEKTNTKNYYNERGLELVPKPENSNDKEFLQSLGIELLDNKISFDADDGTAFVMRDKINCVGLAGLVICIYFDNDYHVPQDCGTRENAKRAYDILKEVL